MADKFSEKKRSEIMAKIKGKDTKPEILVRKYLFSKGFRFRKNRQDLPGKPDIVLPKYRTVIFVHGCFWHGHPHCKKAALPESRKDFWEAKIATNIARDNLNVKKLENLQWNVIIIWQCQISNNNKREEIFPLLVEQIKRNLLIQ